MINVAKRSKIKNIIETKIVKLTTLYLLKYFVM